MKRFAILQLSPFEGRSSGFLKNGPLCDAEQRLFLEGNASCMESYIYRKELLFLIHGILFTPIKDRQAKIMERRRVLYEKMVEYRPYSYAKCVMPSPSDLYADVDVLINEIEKGSWQQVKGNDDLIEELLKDKDALVYRVDSRNN